MIPEEIDSVTDENFGYSTSENISCYSNKSCRYEHVEKIYVVFHC